MQQEERAPQDRTRLFEDDIQRLQCQLSTFQDILSKKDTASRLDTFDADVEHEIAEIFGSPSEMLEAYEYAKLGEAAGWINLPEEAQEPGAQDTPELSLKQRASYHRAVYHSTTITESTILKQRWRTP